MTEFSVYNTSNTLAFYPEPVIYNQEHGYACFGKDHRYYPVGTTFYMFDDCYRCSFDSKCNLSCEDDGSCHSIKMSRYLPCINTLQEVQ